LLPTNEKAHKGDLVMHPYTEQLFQFEHNNCTEVAHHLYILSDEEIKEGDYYYTIVPALNIGEEIYQATGFIGNKTDRIKVIASTNPSLSPFLGFDTESGINVSTELPSPSQSFIEKYVSEYNKGNKIEEVMVLFEERLLSPNEQDFTLDLIVNPKDNTITIKKIKDSWNREEVIELCKGARQTAGEINIDEWIESHL
jgi:hypothetical protein